MNYNTLVTVSCQTGTVLQGDDVITCRQGRHFLFGTQPTCVPSGFIFYESETERAILVVFVARYCVFLILGVMSEIKNRIYIELA